jgi:hypothetical protein
MGDMQPAPNPNDRSPSGPKYTMYHEPNAGRELVLLTELNNLLINFRFVRPVRDDTLNETYNTTLPFIEDILYYTNNPIERRGLRYHMLYIRNMINIANTQNVEGGLGEQNYNQIITNIDELTNLLRHEAPQGTNNAGSALQWTALERLMNLMDKHIEPKV